MKQKLFCMLICCTLLCSNFLSAHAAGTDEYTLNELGMTLCLPSDLVVFTRDIDADDPNLSRFGWTKDEVLTFYDERNIYLDAWDENVTFEICVNMVDSDLADLNFCSDAETAEIPMASEFESIGVTLLKTEIYQHAQAKFLKMYISQPLEDATISILQYYTVYANKSITITMHSFSGETTTLQEELLKSVVDSAVFDTAPQTAESGAFLYTDEKSKATFRVPAIWVEQPFLEDREFLDAKFTSLLDESVFILFSSSDVWSLMPESERYGFTRNDIDNSIFTKSDVADSYGLASSDIDVVTYEGKEFYKATVISNMEMDGFNISFTITYMILIDNGYLYTFQFNGDSDTALYKSFESLLSSLEFAEKEMVIDLNNSPSADVISPINFGNVLTGLLITIVVYSLPIVFYRFAIKQAPVEKKKAGKITIIYGICAFIVMSAIRYMLKGNGAAGGAILLWSFINYIMLTAGYKPAEAPPQTIGNDAGAIASEPVVSREHTEKTEIGYCHKCGNKLIPDSMFCDKCGTKIPR